MRVVADASVVVAALIDGGPIGQWCAEQLVGVELAAPHLMPFEAANIIRRTALRGALDPGDAAAAYHDLDALAVDFIPFTAVSDRVWALRSNLTSYDASYVATAEILACPLLTLDRRMSTAPGLGCRVAVAP